MSEHSSRPESDEELEREREETTDLGYRDTEEERAYEDGAGDEPAEGAGGTGGSEDGGE